MFRTKLLVSPVGTGQLWITEAPFVVESELAGTIVVPSGFVFDGNSVPCITWWVSPPSDFLEAGCVHDFFYRYDDDRKLADRVYKEILKALGMGRCRREFRYLMLRAFGWRAFNQHQEARA